MNEVYVSSPTYTMNSDKVFYMAHVDGPFFCWPHCYLFRSIIGINENQMISTQFPMTPMKATISTGDMVAFDFNREIHYIENDPSKPNTDFRITLKVHYLVYPKSLKRFGKLLG